MKKIHAVLIAVWMMSMSAAMAQTEPVFGLRLGMSVTNWRGDAVQSVNRFVNVTDGKVSTQPQTGMYAGGYMNILMGEVFSIEPGIYFAQKGYTLKGDLQIKALNFLGAGAVTKIQSSYVDVPVIVRANLAGGLQLFAGPQVSYLAKSNLHLNAGVLGISLFNKDVDMTNDFKRWDVGITGGIAYQFSNGLNIQAGYEHGLSRVDANSNFKSYNSGIKAGIGFSF